MQSQDSYFKDTTDFTNFVEKTKVPADVILGRVLLGLTVFGWFGWLSFSCSIRREPFLVGLVDQPFQPAQSSVETVENDG